MSASANLPMRPVVGENDQPIQLFGVPVYVCDAIGPGEMWLMSPDAFNALRETMAALGKPLRAKDA